ncbi:hypothetical protein J6590_077991 [Homalodisca vitripennis]|nr:hypothetical protein J6590_077991 [Homalodisca vitripennis]
MSSMLPIKVGKLYVGLSTSASSKRFLYTHRNKNHVCVWICIPINQQNNNYTCDCGLVRLQHNGPEWYSAQVRLGAEASFSRDTMIPFQWGGIAGTISQPCQPLWRVVLFQVYTSRSFTTKGVPPTCTINLLFPVCGISPVSTTRMSLFFCTREDLCLPTEEAVPSPSVKTQKAMNKFCEFVPLEDYLPSKSNNLVCCESSRIKQLTIKDKQTSIELHPFTSVPHVPFYLKFAPGFRASYSK